MTRSRLEYHYHSDCRRRTGCIPVIEQVISLAFCYPVHILVKRISVKVVAYQTLWLELSFIVGTEVLVNGYSVVKEHREDLSPHCVADEKDCLSPIPQNFFYSGKFFVDGIPRTAIHTRNFRLAQTVYDHACKKLQIVG